MLLLLGPPASGKTSWCVDRLRDAVRAGRDDCRILAPTTTMAEHLRNQLAREGFVFSPGCVSTFSKYVNSFIADVPAADAATLDILLEQVLEATPLTRYGPVRDFPGFRSAAVRAIEECAGAGGSPDHLERAGAEPDFIALCRALLERLEERGLSLRDARLARAAERIASAPHQGRLLVTGFFAFTPPEIGVLRALDCVSDLAVALPESVALQPALAALRTFAQDVQTLPPPAAAARRILVTAPTQDAEATEIARRILEHRTAGTLFREMAVIVRSETSVPAIRTALERFHIPARYYFAPPLTSDPTVCFLRQMITAALGGWDHEQTLAALRMYGSPLERAASGDGFEFDVRKQLPNAGLDSLKALAPLWSHWYFEELAKLDASLAKPAIPAIWADRFAQLAALFRPAVSEDSVPHERALIWRTQAAAIDQFRSCADAAAEALDAVHRTDAREFAAALETTLASATLHVVDRRRNVVHVIDALEARQWRLPLVFAAGLLEGEFPKHFSEEPILPDTIRRRLQSDGVPVRTSHDRQAAEQFLFDMVLTRAADTLYLSYAQLNAKGEPNLPSFLLERARPYQEQGTTRVRPRPLAARAPERKPAILTEEGRHALVQRHACLSASAIESYLRCPFGFFAQKTLKLNEPPARPWDRLTMLVQGTIAHRTFELHFRDGIPVCEAFNKAFAENCAKEYIPDGYRTEAVRLELLHAVEMLVSEIPVGKRARALFEQEFKFAIPGGPAIQGRMDRVEIDTAGNALVIDYKYKNPGKTKEVVAQHESNKAVQAGLYLLGVESLNLGLKPAGVVFVGFKQKTETRGWALPPFDAETGNASSPAMMQQLTASARELAAQTFVNLAGGRIGAAPEEDTICYRCTYLKICRADAKQLERSAGGGK